jgi:hypothetical protein
MKQLTHFGKLMITTDEREANPFRANPDARHGRKNAIDAIFAWSMEQDADAGDFPVRVEVSGMKTGEQPSVQCSAANGGVSPAEESTSAFLTTDERLAEDDDRLHIALPSSIRQRVCRQIFSGAGNREHHTFQKFHVRCEVPTTRAFIIHE